MKTLRRTIVLVTLLAVVGGGAPVAAQAPVKIAFLGSLSGPFTFWGVNVRDGMKMAVDEVNAQGGVLGRRLELVERDDRNSPAEGITAFRFLVEREGVIAGGGMISSDVALAVSREAESLRVPYFLTMAGSDAILSRSSRFTFRTCLPAAPMNMEPMAALIKARNYTRAGGIAADYAWGHAIKDAFERFIAPLPGVQSQIEVAPVGERDFTPYLRRLQRLDPELVVITGHPPGNPTITRQASELGMRGMAIGSWLPPEMMAQRAGDVVFGRFVDYSCVDFEHPEFRRLAEKYRATYGRYFDNNAFSGYVIVKMVAAAAERVKTLDRQAIAEAIRTGEFVQPGYAWPLAYTEWGEMAKAAQILYTFERGDPPGAINPGAGWRQTVVFRSPPVQPYVPEK